MTAFGEDEKHPGVFAMRTPDRPVITMASDGSVVTFADFEARSNQAAHLFRKCGLRRGDSVVLLMENNVDYLQLAWGALRAGLRLSAIATHLAPAEIDYILEDSGARAFITSRPMLDKVSALQSQAIPEQSRFMRGTSQGGLQVSGSSPGRAT